MKTIVVFFFISASVLAQPTDNPVATYYGNGNYPIWTDHIRWDRTINMAEYASGVNDFEKFENARDELHAMGGGVLYYPGGTYDFSDMPADGPTGRGLMLRENIVIRGATPIDDDDARDGTLSLPTKFLFGFDTIAPGKLKPRAWNIVGLMPEEGDSLKNINNVGVAWIQFEGAAIYFGANFKWYDTFDSIPPVEHEDHKLYFLRLECWFCKIKDVWRNIELVDGTHPIHPYYSQTRVSEYLGSGKGRLVFGCLMQDAALTSSPMNYGAGEDSYYTAKVAGRVGVYGSNVLIANNAIPKSEKCFKYQQVTCKINQSNKYEACLDTSVSTVLFDYGKMVGIEVNKSAKGVGKYWELGGFFNWPRSFEGHGVVVRDNYVFNHGHKGYNITGSWLLIQDNHNEREYLQEGNDIYGLGPEWELTRDGYMESENGGAGSVSDNKSRAFDLGGKNLWADSNTFNNLGSSPGNDGEGILCQRFSGTDMYSWALTNNKHLPGSGDVGYIGGYDVHQHGSLIAWNTTPGWVGNAKAGDNIDCAFVNNDADKGVSKTGADVLDSCPSIIPTPPIDVQLAVENDYIIITWEDNSDDEIGFRIDKKMGNEGEWKTVVYRPRKNSGHANNEQIWRDYLAPRGVETYYRVVAINCEDTDDGAGLVAGPVVVSEEFTGLEKLKTNHTNEIEITVYPNPSNEFVNIELFSDTQQYLLIEIYTLHGIKIESLHLSDKKEIITIDTKHYNPGAYVVVLKGQDSQILNKKYFIIN